MPSHSLACDSVILHTVHARLSQQSSLTKAFGVSNYSALSPSSSARTQHTSHCRAQPNGQKQCVFVLVGRHALSSSTLLHLPACLPAEPKGAQRGTGLAEDGDDGASSCESMTDRDMAPA